MVTPPPVSAVPAGPPGSGDDPAAARTAILLALGAVFLFSLLDLQAKWLTQTQPVSQVVWARYFGHFLIMTVFLWPRRGFGLLRTKAPVLQVSRGALLLACTVLFFLAIQRLPLADAVAIGFVAPLLATALSVPLLKEQVGIRRWSAVLVGLLGALIIVRPGLGVFDSAALLVLGMAACFALYQNLTRMVSGTDDSLVSLYYTAIVGALAASFVAPFTWTALPGWPETVMLAGLGIWAGLGHWLYILAFRLAPIAIITPLMYTALVWNTINGYLVFGDLPDRWTLIGAAILIATGLYVLYREGVRRREAVPPPAGDASPS